MKIVATCIPGVESILKKEIEKISNNIIESKDRMISFIGDDYDLININLWSRVANKIYIELANFNATNFDGLFDNIVSIDWKKFLGKNRPIVVDGVSIKSVLTSIPSIQKISKKAIITNITGSKSQFYHENNNLDPVEILIFIDNNNCKILLNTSGAALHKRGYRKNEHEASIKESLAASLVLLSGWKFNEPFYDFFCGAGTILIEALLIAKNIAPGSLGRKFAFETFDFISQDLFSKAKEEAKGKIFNKKFHINGSDIDDDNIKLSIKNLQNIGINEDEIIFEKRDFIDYLKGPNLYGTLVSNPPYGLRLNDYDLNCIYTNLIRIFNSNEKLKGGFITSFEPVDSMIKQKEWKKRKLYNGNEKCYFYKILR